MRNALLTLLLAAMLALCGCRDAVDLGDQIFAINLALDAGQGAPLRLTMQYPQITPVGKDPQQSDSELQKNGYLVEQVEGDDLHGCLELMRMVTPRELSLMQLRGLYIAESLAGERALLGDSLTALLDAYSARPAATVYLTRGRAEDVLLEKTPLFGARLSKSQSAQDGALTALGVIPFAPLNRFYNDLFDADRSAVAVLAAVNNMQYLDVPAFRGAQPTAYLAGELARNTTDTVDLCGSAVFGHEELIYLDGYETQLLGVLTGRLRRLSLTISEGTAVLKILIPPAIRVTADPEQPQAFVTLYVRCEQSNAAAYTESLKQDVLTLLLKLQQHGLDPVGISEHARTRALTISAWQQMDWPALYPRAAFTVDVR